MLVDPADVGEFRSRLSTWFEETKRSLPWREPPFRGDPYAVLVSEVMLQQTRVDTVVPYFEAWMERWPTVEELARAKEEKVLEAWQGLGFYNRARRLHAAAKQILAEHEGRIPETIEDLKDLPGVGPYTAAAVAAFAHEQPTPAVDGNTVRVWARLTGSRVDPSSKSTKDAAREQLAPVVDGEQPRVLVEALIELGATVCTPSNPGCPGCPVSAWCTAYQEDLAGEIPPTSPSQERRTYPVVALLHEDQEGRLLLDKRPREGLLGGLWGLPMAERKDRSRAKAASEALDGASVSLEDEPLATLEHTFSHKRWRVHVHTVTDLPKMPAEGPYKRVRWDELDGYATSTLDEKVFEALRQTTLARFG